MAGGDCLGIPRQHFRWFPPRLCYNNCMQKTELVKQLNDLGKNEGHTFTKVSYFKTARILEKMSDEEFSLGVISFDRFV
jgi:hypothetical protein